MKRMVAAVAVAAVAIVILCAGAARAGSGPANLSCEAKPGQKSPVTLKGLIPDSEETLDITLSDGSASIRMTDADADTHRIEALEQSGFSIIIERKQVYGRVTLYAIPKTVKARKGPHRTHATFDAVLLAPNPQHEGSVRSAGDMLPKLKMSCTYDYEL
jgi:hypothetical protein